LGRRIPIIELILYPHRDIPYCLMPSHTPAK
jgi:hypothetical protein